MNLYELFIRRVARGAQLANNDVVASPTCLSGQRLPAVEAVTISVAQRKNPNNPVEKKKKKQRQSPMSNRTFLVKFELNTNLCVRA